MTAADPAPTADGGHPLRVVIVGGVAGGMSAATRLRRLDESAEILRAERGVLIEQVERRRPGQREKSASAHAQRA